MKRMSLLLVMILAVCLSFAGIDDAYNFNATTGTYTAITGTALTEIHTDDAISGAVPIGFTFPYGDFTYTDVKVGSNGWIGLGTAQTSSNLTNALTSTTVQPVVAPLWDDLSMASGTVQYLLTGTAPNRVYTIQYADVKWNYSGTTALNFQVRLYETGKIDFVYGTGTGTPNYPSASIGINMTPGGSGWFYSVTPGTPATASMTVENLSINAFPAEGTIYEFNPVVAAPNDLAAISISGNTTPSVGTATDYIVQVRNRGTNAQSTYTVKLFMNGTEVATMNGTAIQPNAIIPYTLSWTPTTQGPATLYGKVVLAGDANSQNDQTANYPIVVQPTGVIAVTVGTGGESARLPVDMWWKNSLFETIYLGSELNIGGLITGIQIYNNFVTNLPGKPIKVWLGETTLSDLSANWIPSTEMTLVYDGNIDFPSGMNNILIPLQTPFPYGGGNLAMMVNRPMDTQYFSSSDYFDCQTVGTNRTRNTQSDSTTFDPANPPASPTISGQFPKTTFMLVVDGMGALNGTVYGPGNVPLEGATVTVAGTTLSYVTGPAGTYNFGYVNAGAQQVNATKHGYTSVTHPVTIVEDQTVTQNFTLALLPQVTVTGRIVGSDAPTVGIEGATISLTGYEPYTATTNATGNFTITDVFASQTYNYVAQATGYQPAIGEVVVGTTNVNMGDITVNEMAFPPYGVVAAENATFTQVNLEWQAPNPGATGMTEGFEDATFPPTNWTQVITDTSAPGTTGVAPTWCRVGEVALTPAVPAHGGDWQAATWWSYNHQDEWLITPQFTCPPSADLDFWSYVYFGSTNGDHYYVKVSTDNGSTWTTLWDASTETGGWNYYATPITIPLAAYSGQQIKIAWHAEDPPSNDGLWYVWFLDDITIGTPTQVLQFPMDQFTTRSAAQSNELAQNKVYPSLPTSRAMVNNPRLQEPSLQVVQPSNPDRTLLGYRVWRLLAADQANEANWTQLTPANITPTNYTDTAWGPLPSGVYKYAVKAVYTNSVMSNAAFSNELHKGMMGVLTGTVTEFGTAVPIAGATVTAGEYSGTSNAQGVYNISIYAGTYNVACAKTGYQTATQNNVVITGLQTTTQNFVLTEITLPAAAVQAEIAGNNVNVTWMAPGTGGGEWIHYDSGENNDSIGLTSGGEFSAAIRFPASALSDYAGMSLYAISIYPGDLATYSLRVWTGGTPTAPGTQVVNQPFTVPTADVFQTVLLDNPVTVTGSEELWFGFNVTHTAGLYPAGCDDGPALNGFGNMIYNAGEWSTLYDLASALNYNWNIQGYVGYSAPTSMEDLVPLTLKGLAHPAKSLAPETTTSDRSLVGYNVWRLLQGQEGNEAAWTALTTNPQTATAYQDTNWGTLPDGWYKWAVKAIYTGGAAAQAAFSNAIQRQTEIGTIAGIVRNMANQAIPGATVTAGGVNATTNANGAYSMQVSAGTYTVTATAPGYGAATQPGVVVVTGQTTTVNFQLPASAILLEDGFESYANFVIEFAPWTLLDVDQSTTYGITDHTWDNDYDAQAFIIFNPTATSPAMAAGAEPHAGDKYAACFAATTPDNNDWMIAPLLAGGGEISFWARSYVSTYGLERFKVGVSTTGTNPNDFTFISGTGYIEAPVEWTQYTYDLAAYDDQQIRIGINCVSHDAFFFMVDDVEVTGTGAGEDDLAPVVATKLFNNYPNPFNPETTIRFSVKEASPVTIEIYNVKGQRVRTLVNETKASGNYDVTWNGKDNHGRNVSSGIYYYKMNAGKFSSTKKMILMK